MSSYVIIVAMVKNVQVTVVSATSVNISWDRPEIAGLTSYIVYYSQTGSSANEKSLNVTNSTNSVVIGDLMNDVEYQFQVAAIAELDGDVIIGRRSSVFIAALTTYTTIPTTQELTTLPIAQGKQL